MSILLNAKIGLPSESLGVSTSGAFTLLFFQNDSLNPPAYDPYGVWDNEFNGYINSPVPSSITFEPSLVVKNTATESKILTLKIATNVNPDLNIVQVWSTTIPASSTTTWLPGSTTFSPKESTPYAVYVGSDGSTPTLNIESSDDSFIKIYW